MINSDIRDHAYQFFIEEAPELLQSIEEGLLTIRQEKDKAKVHGIMRAAHSIKGGAASVELEGIKHIAHRLEDIFKALYSDEVVIDAYLENLLLQGYDCLKDSLMEQIETGSYDEQKALEQAEPIFQKIESELGEALTQADDYIPSSTDLGIDVVSSIFEVDVAQELERLTQVVNNPHNYEVAGELRATGEVFAGFAELLSLPGFGEIATVAEQALEYHHDRALEITQLALADFTQAREQVLQGDRKEGGKPSPALLKLAQPPTPPKDELHDHAYQFFIEEAPELLQLIEDGVLKLRQQKTPALVHEIMRAAHSLKGGSASVGLDGIKTIAHRLEDIFKALYSESVIIDEYLESLLLKGYDCLRNPLVVQIKTGKYEPERALAEALPIMEEIEAQLGDALQEAEDYIPSSADLGIDVVSSLFEVDVSEGIEKLGQSIATGELQTIETDLRSQIEIFDGFAELLNLPGFAQIGQTAITALDRHPDELLRIAKLALQDYQKAHQDVSNGDRDRGGSACDELISLAGGEALEADQPVTDELILEESDFDLNNLIEQNFDDHLLLTVSDHYETEFSDVFEDVILDDSLIEIDPQILQLEDNVFEEVVLEENSIEISEELLNINSIFDDIIEDESITETTPEILPVESVFDDVILDETIIENQGEILPVETIFDDVILDETIIENQGEILPVETIFDDVILDETVIENQGEILPVETIFDDVILDETIIENQGEILPVETIFDDVILDETVIENQGEILPVESIFDDVILDETVIENQGEILPVESIFDDVTLDETVTEIPQKIEIISEKSISLDEAFNDVFLEEIPNLDEVFKEVITEKTPSLDDVFGKFAGEELINESVIEKPIIEEKPVAEIKPIVEKLPEKIEEKYSIESLINSVEQAFVNLPSAQNIDQLVEQAEQKLKQIQSHKKPQTEKENTQATQTSNLSVRVDLNRLERMNDLVGELAINRNGLSLQNEQLQGQVQELFNRFSKFQNLTQELQKLSDKMLISPEKQPIYELKSPRPNSLSEMQDLITSTEEFDSLEMDRYSVLHSMIQSFLEEIMILEEAVDDIVLYARQSNQTIEEQRQMLTRLRDELMWARMLPLGEVLRRFPRVLRDLSNKHKKPVNLKLTGTGVLVDKAVLEKLYDPLLHLLRNAFDHGIENPEERRKRGKPEEGIITVRAYHQGSQTIIEMSDDGEGLQLDKIAKRAVERGLLSMAQLEVIEPNQLLDFIFEPGFSTAEKVSELSGRGVGLDVVRSQLRSLKGNVSVNSKPGKGTSFILSLPLTLTIAKLLVCIVGSSAIAFPSDSIEEIIVPKANQIHKSGTQRFLYWREQAVPTYNLKDLLEYGCPLPDLLPSKALGAVNTPSDWALPLLIIRQENQYWALEVDRLVTEQELVVKPFGTAIKPPPYIYGCTILGDGSLVPVIEGNSLIEMTLEGGSTSVRNSNLSSSVVLNLTTETEESSQIEVSKPEEPSVSTAQITIPRILVVDDSAALRRTLAFSLQKAGYRVFQAKDGKEALQQLQQGTMVDLVICDVEMPNMNGFEFLGQRRREASIKDIPVAMLTSRSNDKHRRLAMQLGASAYFSKPYVEQEFLTAIKDMITQKNPAMAGALR